MAFDRNWSFASGRPQGDPTRRSLAIIARLDHPSADEANAQALDDLANGADGLQVVSSGALGAYGFGLRQFDSATLHKAFDGVRSMRGRFSNLILGPTAPTGRFILAL